MMIVKFTFSATLDVAALTSNFSLGSGLSVKLHQLEQRRQILRPR